MSEFFCDNCGNDDFTEGVISKVFNIKDKLILVENIPALICSRCEEAILTMETTEHIRIMLNSNKKPLRHISTQVFEYV